MKKPFNVLATTLIAGTVFASSISPVFAEDDGIAVISEENMPQPSQPTETNDLRGVTQFKDVPAKTELAYAVQYLNDSGIAKGYGETFGVNDPIKRVDFAVMLGMYMPLYTSDSPKSGFRDLPVRAEYIVSALKYIGVTNGKTATLFGAEDSITRGEAAIMLYNAFKDYFDPAEDIPAPFTDLSSRYEEAVRVLNKAGIIKGINNTKFGTNNSITRGQVAMLIHRIYKHEQRLRAEAKSGFVAFGDSNTSGSYYGLQYPEYLDEQWADQVAAVYGAGLKEDEYNAGFSGNTTKQGLDRFKAEVLDVKPHSVTIMFGMNDALLKPNGEPQVSKEDFRKNLTYMINQLRERDIEVVLMTNPAVIEKTYYASELSKGRDVASSYTKLGGLRAWINSYNDIIRKLAKERSLPLVDTYNVLFKRAGGGTDPVLIKSGFLDDLTGIHMTPKANDIIAKEVRKILAERDVILSERDGVSIKAEKTSYKLNEIKDVKLTIENKSNVSYNYAPVFTIQKKVETDWVTLDQDPEIAPPAVMNSLDANKTVTEYAHFSTLNLPVTTGSYRIVHTFGNENGKSVKLAVRIDVTE
ncbi:GDSL-type esterase/lipase family protein [Domibacillus robiginosus]|uniref:GDSL-type esterase/lipase family protein n=1 Tax=Domibacillus robiginosus TaxID=1071054 RepID=UPI00067DD270|nr:GDSL-type esterase/lipase family protein [Domibacillus robiginosus]